MKRSECKEIAKNILKDQWIVGFVVVLIQGLITGALTTVSGGIGTFLLSSSIAIAGYNVFINGWT